MLNILVEVSEWLNRSQKERDLLQIQLTRIQKWQEKYKIQKLYSVMNPRTVAAISIASRFAEVEATHSVMKSQDLKTKEYLSKCPTGKIPLAEFEEGPVFQSTAILRYLARLNPSQGLYGKNNYEAALVDQWLSFFETSLVPNIEVMLLQNLGRMPLNEAMYNQANKDFKSNLRIVNDYLKEKDFLVGDTITIADIYAATSLSFPMQFTVDPGYQKAIKNVVEWFTKLMAKPQFRASLGNVKLAKKVEKLKFPAQVKEVKKEQEKPKPAPAKKEEKKVNPLDLIETDFNFFDFKTELANSKDRRETLDKFFKEVDRKAFAIYHLKYEKAEGEGEKVYMTNNLLTGWLQRLDEFRKYTFGVHGVYGDEPKLEVAGMYIWKGTGVPAEITEHPTGEYYEKVPMDLDNPEHQNLIKDFFTKFEDKDGTVNGMTPRTVKLFK